MGLDLKLPKMDLGTLQFSKSANQAAAADNASAVAPCPSCSAQNIQRVASSLAKYYPDASQELLTSMAVALTMAHDNPVYPKSLGTILASIAATINLTPINVQQKDCFVQIERFVRLLDEKHFPRFLNMTPAVINFDGDGLVNGDTQLNKAIISVPAASDKAVTLGVLLIVKRADLLNGVCQVGISSPVFTGSYELTDNTREARVAMLSATGLKDSTVTFTAGEGGKYALSQEDVNDANSFALDIVNSDFSVTGINCNVKAYPLTMNREKFSKVLTTLLSRDASKLAGTMLDYV